MAIRSSIYSVVAYIVKGGATCIEASVSSYLAAPIWWGSAENQTASAYGDYKRGLKSSIAATMAT